MLIIFVFSAPGGELQMVLDKDEVPEERQVARLMKQILDGIAFLHSLNVAHLDIKVSRLITNCKPRAYDYEHHKVPASRGRGTRMNKIMLHISRPLNSLTVKCQKIERRERLLG